MTKKKTDCPDCGGAQVNHTITYVSVLLNKFVEPWMNFLSGWVPEEKMEWIGPGFIKCMNICRLGYVTKEPTEKDSGRTQVLWNEAIKRDISMYEFHPLGIGHDVFITRHNGAMRFFDVLPRPKGYNPKGLTWMDDKHEMKKHFRRAGIPVAQGTIAGSKKEALKIFNSLAAPVITKPSIGSRSRHTTTHLMSEEEFMVGFEKAKQLSPWVMIEEELTGFVFRGTLIGKKFVAAIRREPENVIGNGVHTIRELVEIENKNPLRHGPIFHQIGMGADEEKELSFWKRTWNTIPAKDEVVTLGQKTSRAVGGGITDVTDDMHPDNVAMLETIALVLDDPLIGVDFIMNDVSISWKHQPRCGVIECNSAPFIDLHHFPLVGKPRNVASALWDIIYPDSSQLQS